ncbi:MAG: hypothetical protein JXR96_02075 [Deltaproteobacteria bacterium]|nr:hypothetical protein [Deltaproteobacteria bacterium]
MKRRAQIQLERDDHEALKRWARQRGISVSAAVRWLLREHLLDPMPMDDEQVRAFVEAAGAIEGSEGEGDVAERHDDYLYGDDGS